MVLTACKQDHYALHALLANLTGLSDVTSSAHRISVYSVNKSHQRTANKLQEFVDKKSPIAPLTWPEEFPTQGWDEYKQFWKENDPRDVDE